jgi:hypothetical protein
MKNYVFISDFTRDGKCDSDIERKVNGGNTVNGALYAFMNSRVVSKKAQLAVHNEVLLPTLMYGSESWVWQKKHKMEVRVGYGRRSIQVK